jgi:hypothetical protein
MQRGILQCMFTRTVALGIIVIFLAGISSSQLEQAPAPIADPRDKRFEGVKEDLNTPALDTSTLRAVAPLIMPIEYDSYAAELIQVQWRWGDPLDLWVIRPKGVHKPPVVLYLFGYPTDTDRFKNEDFQKEAIKDGFAAVGFVSALTGHRYHDRPMKEWFVSNLQESLAESAHDVQMVLNYLATRDDLDMSRVGMYTLGSGSSIAIMASAVDPRIQVLDTLDPWGNWPVWLAKSPVVPNDERSQYATPDFLKKVAPLEPMTWLPKIQAKKFRLQERTFDLATPKECQKKLRKAVPRGATVVFYKTPAEFQAMVRSQTQLDWVKQQLRSLPETSTAALQKH